MVMVRVYTWSVRDINFKEFRGKGVDLKKEVMKDSNYIASFGTRMNSIIVYVHVLFKKNPIPRIENYPHLIKTIEDSYRHVEQTIRDQNFTIERGENFVKAKVSI